jgi:hypothetical protein
VLRGGASLYTYMEGQDKMNMATDETLMKFELIKDEHNSQLKEFFKNNSILKEIHIDTYPDNPIVTSSEPFMLLLRTIEKNIIVKNDGNRLVLKRNINKFETHFMNVLFSSVAECYYKIVNNGYSEFILNIQNIYYRITVFN